MTDKEFKRLSRAQLIEIIYQLQLKQEELMEENEKLSEAVANKRLMVENAGNIAEAALEVNNVMQAAQNAATHYLEEIQARVREERRRILQDAKAEAAAIVANASQEAGKILAHAKAVNPNYDPAVEAILKEFGSKQ